MSIEQLESHFRRISTFSSLSKENLNTLADYTKVLEVQKDGHLILQGESHHYLFFLMEGQVSIQLDHIEIAEINTIGEIIGEMSIIDGTQSHASVFCKTNSVFLAVDKDILKVAGWLSIFYSIFTNSLVHKLRSTNHHAKKYKETLKQLKSTQEELLAVNRNLEDKVAKRTQDAESSLQRLEQQNVELIASREKLIEIASVKRNALNRIEDLYKRVLPSLETHLTQIATKSSGDDLTELVRLKMDVQNVVNLIRPLAAQAQVEQSVKSKRVLVVEQEKRQQIQIKMAMGGSGVDLTLAANKLEARNAIEEHNFDLVIANTENTEVLIEAGRNLKESKLVLIASDEIREYLGVLERSDRINYMVSRDKGNRPFTGRTILSTITKLLSNEIFGMEKYLAWGVEVYEWPVVGSAQRKDLIQNMCDYFGNLGVRKGFLDRCSLVAEEMLMNAIYDAPTDAQGRAKYNHMSRTEAIDLKADEQASFRVACDGALLAISVSDPFGALNKYTLLKHLRSCYDGFQTNLSEDKGGAGRGLHQIVEHSDLTIFNVKKSTKTEVISLFHLDSIAMHEGKTRFHFFFD